MEDYFDEQKAQQELEKGYPKAKKLLNDPEAFEKFLQRLERKLRVIPKAGDTLASLPVLVSCIKSYVKKEYTEIPLGSILAIISACIYFVSPVDVIPDIVPGIGHLDDALVIAVCLKFVQSDVDEYIEWRKANGKALHN